VLAGIDRPFRCLSLTAARAQTPIPDVTPGSTQQDTTTQNCANGDVSACQSLTPSTSTSTTTTNGLSGGGAGSSLAFPSMTPGAPNAPMSVYRDDADGGDRTAGLRQRTPVSIKPQPLTEFQMLVAGSIGRIVPVYGADLFANVPDTFAPVQRLPVTPDYVIGPGDELLIRTWGQVTQNLHLTGDRSGSVYIPGGRVSRCRPAVQAIAGIPEGAI
jgi:hypothetical protein